MQVVCRLTVYADIEGRERCEADCMEGLEMRTMKIKEARQAYTAQLEVLRNRQRKLLKAREENDAQFKYSSQEEVWNGGSGVVLELSEEYRKRSRELQEQIDKVKEQIEEHIKLRDQVIQLETGIANAESAKQQGEAMKEYGEEVAKCLEIARRIANGDKVPASDEKKLMDFNMEIYQTAKHMAAMNMDKKHKEYESLWEEEEDGKEEQTDPLETAGETEVTVEIPDIEPEG